MQSQAPAVFSTVKLALKDALQAYRTMPWLFACVFVLAVTSRQTLFISHRVGGAPLEYWQLLSNFLHPIIANMVHAPFAVAVHRYVIKNEISDIFSLYHARRSIFKFAFMIAFLSFITSIPTEATAILGLPKSFTEICIYLVCLLAIIFAGYWSMRFILVFPAIAVQNDDNLTPFVRGTKGLFWRLFAIVMILGIIIEFIPIIIALSGKTDDLIVNYSSIILSGIADTVLFAAWVAVASRFYMWRVSQPLPSSVAKV